VVDRRGLLVAGAAGLLLPACGAAGGPSGGPEDGQGDRGTDPRGDAEALNRLLALEHQSVAIYRSAVTPLLRRLLAREREHVARLESAVRDLGGRPARPEEGDLPAGDPLGLAQRVEETAVAAYRKTLPTVADARLRGLLASIVAVEAEHLAAVSLAQGRTASPAAFVTGRRGL
jgi:ferritin-like protein